ncbi:similar to RAB GTPASE HOMOLOG B18 [Actinidia rufa]|uniref:Similar to RAB GTPASE HOMOLOG B18 n=1 Tax=Actinidia rufa TaxID=165716 RepID=A0A7J0GV08_9ERIC|nr:similar to RAB GTPASE HOMOLOG B18 [Actinidia rufa]
MSKQCNSFVIFFLFLVYDVTRRETFTNLLETWAKEVELYSTNQDCIKILVANKVDRDEDFDDAHYFQDGERAVSVEEGMALAEEHKCLFFECSAKTREKVQQCFKELTVKMLEIPSLVEKGSVVVKRQILNHKKVCQKSSRWELLLFLASRNTPKQCR